jgi:Flp pilus assembly protein TadG
MQRTRNELGQALAEFALAAPIFFLLVFGIVDLARCYNAWVSVQSAAREGARYAVTGRSDCDGASERTECIEEVAREHAGHLANSSKALTVSMRSWNQPEYADPAIEDDAGNQCDAVEVSVKYEFKPAVPVIGNIIGPVTMTGSERMVNEPFGKC